ncbi:hypersensitive response inducing protein 1 [Stemphylium lycopersici]|nr:hypersensitive response inducing protein 1 [Stemphylium lycopersici]RAR01870.1 hypersensitive response inducing protein 1 [Stemphylium lycopersici]
MRPTTLIPLVLAPCATAIATPAVNARDDAACAPISYTISNYTLTTSPSSGTVAFTFKSNFSDSGDIIDAVQNGACCSASGASVPNANACDVPGRRLLFDLRGPQEQAYYQITHTWTCEGFSCFWSVFYEPELIHLCDRSTWMSGNAVKIDPLTCHTEGETRICTGGPLTVTPQNVRRICATPNC